MSLIMSVQYASNNKVLATSVMFFQLRDCILANDATKFSEALKQLPVEGWDQESMLKKLLSKKNEDEDTSAREHLIKGFQGLCIYCSGCIDCVTTCNASSIIQAVKQYVPDLFTE